MDEPSLTEVERLLDALEPLARLGLTVSPAAKRDAVFVGSVVRGASPEEDRYHPLTNGHLLDALAIFIDTKGEPPQGLTPEQRGFAKEARRAG